MNYSLNFIHFGMFGCLFPISDILYLWECIFNFLVIVHEETNPPLRVSNFDLLNYIGVTLLLVFYRIIYDRHQNYLLSLSTKKITRQSQARAYIQQIYSLFYNQLNNRENTFKLASALSSHIRECRHPYCLCFFCKVYFDPNTIGKRFRTLRSLLDSNIQKIDSLAKANTITVFRDPKAVNQLRKQHTLLAASDSGSESSGISVVPKGEEVKNEANFLYILNLKSEPQILRLICSFYVTFMDRVKGSVFDLYLDKVSFFLFEYKNYVSTLISLYEFIYSVAYVRERSFFKSIIIQNYIIIAKKRLQQSTQTIATQAERDQRQDLDLSKLLSYRE